MIIIDTDIFVDYSRKFQPSQNFFSSLSVSSQKKAVSIITCMELIQGCKDKQEMINAEQFLKPFQVIRVSDDISDLAHGFMKSFCLSHGLRIPDALIAASAVLHNAILYTRNHKHFEMIPNLSAQTPY